MELVLFHSHPLQRFASGRITVSTEFDQINDMRNWVPKITKKNKNIEGNQPIFDIIQESARKRDAINAQISLAWMLRKYPKVV